MDRGNIATRVDSTCFPGAPRELSIRTAGLAREFRFALTLLW